MHKSETQKILEVAQGALEECPVPATIAGDPNLLVVAAIFQQLYEQKGGLDKVLKNHSNSYRSK